MDCTIGAKYSLHPHSCLSIIKIQNYLSDLQGTLTFSRIDNALKYRVEWRVNSHSLSEVSPDFYLFIFWLEVLRYACNNHLITSPEETLAVTRKMSPGSRSNESLAFCSDVEKF